MVERGDLIHEQGAALRRFDQPSLRAVGARERAFLMTK